MKNKKLSAMYDEMGALWETVGDAQKAALAHATAKAIATGKPPKNENSDIAAVDEFYELETAIQKKVFDLEIVNQETYAAALETYNKLYESKMKKLENEFGNWLCYATKFKNPWTGGYGIGR